MQTPKKDKRKKIDQLPSTWSDVDFSSMQDNEKLYWFESRRINAWLINDTKKIKEKGESMFGLAAMVCVGVEFLSRFRYGKDKPNEYFPKFLEEYLDKKFKYKVKKPYNPNPPANNYEKWFYTKPYLKYSEIFYFGLRNQLIHNFLLRHTVIIEPLSTLLKWERKKKRLLVDVRYLLISFENGINKYLKELWKSKKGEEIYENFFSVFTLNFQRKF